MKYVIHIFIFHTGIFINFFFIVCCSGVDLEYIVLHESMCINMDPSKNISISTTIANCPAFESQKAILFLSVKPICRVQCSNIPQKQKNNNNNIVFRGQTWTLNAFHSKVSNSVISVPIYRCRRCCRDWNSFGKLLLLAFLSFASFLFWHQRFVDYCASPLTLYSWAMVSKFEST